MYGGERMMVERDEKSPYQLSAAEFPRQWAFNNKQRLLEFFYSTKQISPLELSWVQIIISSRSR